MTLTSADISMLYERHATELLRFFVRRTFDAQIAVDMVGETYAVAFEQRRKMRGSLDGAGRSWLFGIGNNLLNDFFRSGQIERRAMERLGVAETHVSDDQIERIEQLAGSVELRTAIAAALDDLSPPHRHALQLRVVEELSYSEVADRMAVTEQVARARVSRGLRKLREVMNTTEAREVVERA